MIKSNAHHTRRWRTVRGLAWAMSGLSAVMLLTTTASALPPGTAAAGGLTMSPATGDSSTTFSLVFDVALQACPGDAIGGYRWSTFITPFTNDPAPMTYSPSGSPSGPDFTGALRDPIGTQIRAQTPGLGDGLVVAPGGLSFDSSAYAALTPGNYWIGIACTLPDNNGVVQTEKFWARAINIAASSGAGVNNFTYAASGQVATTTTTTTTTTAGTTTTTQATGTTTTTVAGGTSTSTTSTLAATTTTTFRFPTTTVRFASGAPTGGGGGALANTGSSSTALILWAAALLVFGRVALLAGRRIRVVVKDDR